MTREIGDMRAMAQRQLDGMTVNRDLMARDVLALTAMLAKYEDRVGELCATIRVLEEQVKDLRGRFSESFDAHPAPGEGGYAKAFSDIFKDLKRP